MRVLIFALTVWLAGCSAWQKRPSLETLEAEVELMERAFAATMAKRDFAVFQSYLAEDAIFYAGEKPIRGKAAIAHEWQAFFAREGGAPFSWAPDHVEVLASGDLAHSSGPVFSPDGRRIGRFNSVWRRDRDGEWRVILDKGCMRSCGCAD